jgi:hypothetical protein
VIVRYFPGGLSHLLPLALRSARPGRGKIRDTEDEGGRQRALWRATTSSRSGDGGRNRRPGEAARWGIARRSLRAGGWHLPREHWSFRSPVVRW